MDKSKIKNKCIYFISLLTMICILVMISYFFFMRNIEVDIMDNANFVYQGENGTATVTISAKQGDLNQRTQDFLDTVQYEVSPNTDLSNGQTIHVTATYDEELAQEYHYSVPSTEMDVVVSGLPNRYNSIDDIPNTLVEDSKEYAQSYVEENAKNIYSLDGQGNNASLDKVKFVYSAYLKSNASKNSDRFVYILKLHYGEEIIYYMVCVPNINDSNQIEEQNIYGEKAYLTQIEIDNKDYAGYVSRIFSTNYQIQENQ